MITDAQRIDAAFQAILEGRFDALEVHDVLQGRLGSIRDYWRLREQRGIAMQIERACGYAHDEIRRTRARAIREVEEILTRSNR